MPHPALVDLVGWPIFVGMVVALIGWAWWRREQPMRELRKGNARTDQAEPPAARDDEEDGLPSRRCVPARDAGPKGGWLVIVVRIPDEVRSLCEVIASRQANLVTIADDTDRALAVWARAHDAETAATLLRSRGVVDVTVTGDPAEAVRESFARMGIRAKMS